MERHRSGADWFYPAEFSTDVTIHLQYSNWDEVHVFTCNICGATWLLNSRYTDRPPYIGNATRLDKQKLARVLARKDDIMQNGSSGVPSV